MVVTNSAVAVAPNKRLPEWVVVVALRAPTYMAVVVLAQEERIRALWLVAVAWAAQRVRLYLFEIHCVENVAVVAD